MSYTRKAIYTARQLCGITFSNIENMFAYVNMSAMCLKIGMVGGCLKKLAPFKNNKTDALLGWFHTIGELYISY